MPSDGHALFHFRSYWDVLRKRREVLIVSLILGSLLGYLVSEAMRALYMARVKLLVRPDKPILELFPETVQWSGDRQFYETHAVIIQSIPILTEVRDKLQPRLEEKWFKGRKYDEQKALLLLQDKISVTRVENTSILMIRALDNDRELARDLANEVAQSYLSNRKARKDERTVDAYSYLNQELREMKAKLEEAEQKLETFKQEKGVTLVGDKDIEVKSLEEFHTGWLTLQQERMAREARLEQLTKLKNEQGIGAVAAVVDDMTIRSLQAKTAELEIQVEGLRQEYTEKHPALQEKLNELQSTADRLNKEIGSAMEALETEVRVARLKEESAAQALESYRQRKVEVDQTSLEVQKLEGDVETYQSMYDALNKKLKMEQVTEDVPTESIEVVEAAQTPNRAVRPNVPLNIALGFISGMALGLTLVFLLEYMDDSIAVIEDIEEHIKIPVLGTVPKGIKMLYDASPKSLSAEVYRTLRTNLKFSFVDKPLRSMVVTSGGAGEGKSTTSANLGIIMAQGGQKVIIVDTDLRRPVIHRYFNLERAIGVTGVLADEVTLEKAIYHNVFPNLSILPSGSLPPNPAELLGSMKMRLLKQRLLEEYDVVIFDTPPVLGFSDSPMVASQVDGVLLVIEYGRYPRQMVMRAKATLENVRARVIGAVLNNIRVERESYYYYSYPYYYKYYSYYSHYYTYAEEEEKAGSAKAS